MAKKEIFDLSSIQTDGEPFPFEFGGERFLMSADPDVKMWEYLGKGDIQMALWLAMGEDQYQVLDAVADVLTTSRCRALLDAYAKHCGIDPGKSSGPSRSSKRISGK